MKTFLLLALLASPPSSGSGFLPMPDGAQLFYRRFGSGGEIVVMLHGGPASDMNSSLPDLKPIGRGRTLFFYDQRGGGRSTPAVEPSDLSVDRHVLDLEALRQRLGLARLTLFGHSWGAGLALLYAMEHPDRVDRLILVGSLWPRRSPYADMYQATLRRRLGAVDYARYVDLAESMETADDPPRVCAEFLRLYLRAAGTSPEGMRRIRGDPCSGSTEVTRTFIRRSQITMDSLGDYDWRSRLASVRARTLVIHGERDIVPEASSRELASLIPSARMLSIPKAGHLPYADQPGLFYGAVDDFLRGRWPSGAARARPARPRES